ncbi:adenylosuccinate lyase [Nonlabens marinus]|nr:adenylosuccinate lyase [Nonlabens marinus]
MTELILLCRPESGVSHQACWCLEQSFLLHESECYPHLKDICALFPTAINHSGMRSLTKIGYLVSKAYYSRKRHPLQSLLSIKMREQLVEGCFNELLTARGKTANLAFATKALFLLGQEFEWVHQQLPALIEEHLPNPQNAGYKSVAGKVLKNLNA